MNVREFCVADTITIRDAMRQIDKCPQKILFVEKAGRLLGTLTDGDMRRHLIGGGDMDDPAELAANHHPKTARNMGQAKTLYHAKNYIAIPVVDEDMKILDVYFGDQSEMRRGTALHIPVVINAGGKGTRLEPFTRVLPKPLIPVGDLPIIEHIMKQFLGYECARFHVIVNYKKELMKAYFAESDNRYDVAWYDETVPLGTGGGLSLLRGKIHETFFFTNCDILLQSNYESMLRFHRESGNAVTMICAYKNLQIPYGVVEMGKNGAVKSMKEKPELSFLTNTGMYIVEPEVLDDIEPGVPVGFPDIIEMQMKKGRHVAVYPVSENEWMDMGQLPELEKMRVRLYGD